MRDPELIEILEEKVMNGMNHGNNYGYAYDPFREMERLEKDFFGSPVNGRQNRQEPEPLRTDLLDEGNYYTLEADLPGFDRDDIHLNLDGDILTIQAERQAREENENHRYVRMERSYGAYSRQFNVSEIDTRNLRAAYENGVLKLALPKKQAMRPESRVLTID